MAHFNDSLDLIQNPNKNESVHVTIFALLQYDAIITSYY